MSYKVLFSSSRRSWEHTTENGSIHLHCTLKCSIKNIKTGPKQRDWELKVPRSHYMHSELGRPWLDLPLKAQLVQADILINADESLSEQWLQKFNNPLLSTYRLGFFKILFSLVRFFIYSKCSPIQTRAQAGYLSHPCQNLFLFPIIKISPKQKGNHHILIWTEWCILP